MKKHWWKVLGVLFLLYVLIGGLAVKLTPGIYKVSKFEQYKANQEYSIDVVGYNTAFTSSKRIEAWLVNDNMKPGIAYCANNVSAINDTLVRINFSFPNNIGATDNHLFIQSDVDGVMSLVSAVQVFEQEGEVNKTLFCEKGSIEQRTGFSFPFREQLYETIRNLFFHVPMWFAMMTLTLISMVFSIRFLSSGKEWHDIVAKQAVNVGLLFAVFGLLTGSLWAKYTWGAWWVMEDTKLNGAAITTLVYLAYIVLRSSINEEQKRARLAAIYNIFAFVMMLVFIMILPRMLDTLHPGNGGNPAFSQYDLDSSLRAFFYTAVIGWILLGVWILNLRVRIEKISNKELDDE